MPIVIYERPTSRPFTVDASTEGVTRHYFVSGTDDEQAVYNALAAETPAMLALMPRVSIKAEPVMGGHWFGEVEWRTGDPSKAVGRDPPAPATPDATTPLDASFSIDTTGTTTHITQAIETFYRRTAADNGLAAGAVGTGPDEKLAIGLTKDRVEGVDVYAPALQFSRTVQRANVTLEYINSALYVLTGRTNRNPFFGFARGEVLYLGCTGNFTQRERWSLTHKFACQPNEENLMIGDIKIPKKWGWQYLWVGYDPEVVVNKVLMVPKVAYVQDVYQEGDFALLGIGGT